MTRDELERTVTEFMDAHTTMNLACCDVRGPWAAAVYYARRRFDLIFFSSPSSRHSTAYADDPRAAATIHGQYSRWQDIKGLQLEGEITRITSALELTRAGAVYMRRFPFVKEFFSEPASFSAELTAKVSRVGLYVFRPTSVRYVNNEVGFGTRWELEIREGRAVGEPRQA